MRGAKHAIDLEVVCVTCRSSFWWTADEQRRYEQGETWHPQWCPDCRTLGRRRTQSFEREATGRETALALGEPPLASDALQSLDHDGLLRRLRDLLIEATEPINWKQPGVVDLLLGRHPNDVDCQRSNYACQQANYLIATIQQCLQTARQQAETQGAIFQQQLEAKLAVMRAEVERRRLQAEMERIDLERQTRRLQAAASQQALLEPPKPPPPAASRAERIMSEHREKYSSKNTAEQALITDFRNEVGNIYMSEGGRCEKAARIEAVMRTYKFGREMLPRLARRLLERVEQEDDRVTR